jgi:hypothetical protein
LEPLHSKRNAEGFLIIDYNRYEQEVTPADMIYWQLCQEFGKSEVDTWDDETYLEAYAALCRIGKAMKEASKANKDADENGG